MKEQAKITLKNAIENLRQANEELFKPKEDIVSYAVCKNSQFAIENYLKGYLLKSNIFVEEPTTIEALYEKCKNLNPAFKKIDVSEFNCKSHKLDSRYCNDVAKVSNCFDVADNLDTLLRQEKII